MSPSGYGASANEPALIAALTTQSGRHAYTTETAIHWEYAYELDAPGMHDERRTGWLRATGVKLHAAATGDRVSTPWGTMQRMPDSEHDRGWLLERSHGAPIDDTIGALIRVPARTPSRGGRWSSTVGAWRYSVAASQMGSRHERRIGWLSYQRAPVPGDAPGDAIETPWGRLVWSGAITPDTPGEYEQGWLARGIHDRPLAAGSHGVSLRLDLNPRFRAESVYLGAQVPLSPDAPPGRKFTLSVNGWLGEESVLGQLVVDPNVCQLNEFGDRTSCTRIASRTYDVALTRLRIPDPAHLDRKVFAVTGQGLPEDLVLVVYPYGDRMYLKHDRAIVPLFQDDGVP